MRTSTCPSCREAINAEALACPFCQRELTSVRHGGKCSPGWLVALALAAVVTAGTAVLIRGFLEERRHWLE